MEIVFISVTRNYQLMYLDLPLQDGISADENSYEKLEKTMKSIKTTHRNIMEIEREYIVSEMNS